MSLPVIVCTNVSITPAGVGSWGGVTVRTGLLASGVGLRRLSHPLCFYRIDACGRSEPVPSTSFMIVLADLGFGCYGYRFAYQNIVICVAG